MARATLTVYVGDLNGVAVTETTGTADDIEFVNTGKEVLIVRNTDAGGAHTYTILGKGTSSWGADTADEACSVALSGMNVHANIETSRFNTTGGKVEIDLEGGEEEHFELSVVKAQDVS